MKLQTTPISKLLNVINKKKKLLTIIIPVYNSSSYLVICLQSICYQLKQNYELIIINDNSTDNSSKIINKFAQTYSNIKIINNRENKGPGHCRNQALKKAKGRYICFIDSDDFVNQGYFDNLISTARDFNSDIVLCNFQIVGEAAPNSRVKKMLTSYNYIDKNKLIKHGVTATAPWAKLYSARFIKRYELCFNNESYIGEDIQFTWVGYTLSRNVSFQPNSIYFYRENPFGCDKQVDKNILGIFTSLKETKRLYYKSKKTNAYDTYFFKLLITHIFYNYNKMTGNISNTSLIQEYDNHAKIFLKDIDKNIVNKDTLSSDEIAYLESISS